jgi:hypothetical protein
MATLTAGLASKRLRQQPRDPSFVWLAKTRQSDQYVLAGRWLFSIRPEQPIPPGQIEPKLLSVSERSAE